MSETFPSTTGGRDAAAGNTYFDALPVYLPGTETLAPDAMRITFMGTSVVPRLSQACNSVFVELGNGDSFVFDCGMGVVVKYIAMGVTLARMDKVFLTHLHADHTSDLTYIYGFGPSIDRRSPLYVWGPAASGVPDPVTGELYDDGTAAYCRLMRSAMRWHTESQSFLSSGHTGFEPPAWDRTRSRDGYDLVCFELPWQVEGGRAYEDHGVLVTHFPAVHCRKGSISYKLEWNGLSMIFTGDTKPSDFVIKAADPGVDVLIHEIVVPPEVWAEKNTNFRKGDPAWPFVVAMARQIEDSSHTPQQAFGYILSRIAKPPRLAVGTHFQATDDTIGPALADIRAWYPQGDVVIANDLMVIDVSHEAIRVRRAVVPEYAWNPPPHLPTRPDDRITLPKYNDGRTGDPLAQLDADALAKRVIPPEVYTRR